MAVLRSLVTTLGLNAAQFREELARSRKDFTTFGGHVVNTGKVVAGGVRTLVTEVFSLRTALIALGSGAALAGIKAAYDSIDKTANLGRNIGIAAQQWHAYAQAAEWAGTNGERLSDVVKELLQADWTVGPGLGGNVARSATARFLRRAAKDERSRCPFLAR